MDYKMIVTDLDDTLLTSDKKISPEDLEAIKKAQEKGFEVLDFPCNQFLNQAPGTNEEIAEFCQLRFGAKFRTFGKIKVNGQDAEPLYKYLKENSKGAFFGNEIKWNFTKFLIDREGNIVKRYAPTTKPEDLEEDIKDLL